MLDNPFLIRELRQLERRPRGVQNSLLICLGLMALVLVGCAALLSHIQNENRSVGSGEADILRSGVWILAILHICLCTIAAAYGAYRIFYIEDSRSTLEPLKLLPYSTVQWIWLKSVFPILCILVGWAAGLPFFILAALCTLISTKDISHWTQKPLLAGAAILLVTLLYTPELTSKQQEVTNEQQKGINYQDRDYSIWSSLNLSIIAFTIAGLVIGQGPLDGELGWFSLTIPEGLLWLGAFSAVLPAAVTTAGTALVISERKRIAAWYLRLLALGVLYSIPVGLLWPIMSPWLKIGALLLPLVFWFFTKAKTERYENEHNEAYVQRIAAIWDNPLLIQDLRVAGRDVRLSRLFLKTLFELAAWPLVIYLATKWLGGPRAFPPIIWCMASGALQGLPMAWSTVTSRWQQEWSSQTMTQLLTTPLTDREIVLGRMAAVPLFQWVGMSPWFPATIALTTWVIWQGYWFAGPIALALCPLLISAGAWASAGITKRRYDQARWGFKDIPMVFLMGCQALVFYGCFIIANAGIDPTSTFINWVPDPVTGWSWGFGLFLLNTALAWGWIELRVWELHRFRRGRY